MQKLQARYEAGVKQLVGIFKEVGYDDDEKGTVFENLTERVIAVVDKVVEEQERFLLELEKEIAETYKEIHNLSGALNKSVPDLSVFSEMPLKVMLRNYQVQLAKLQSEKDAVMKELTSEWSKLQSLWKDLGTPRNPQAFGSEASSGVNEFDAVGEFTTIDDTKLGPAVVRRFRMAVQHWAEERNARASAISDLTNMIVQLETQLGEEPFVPDARLPLYCFERINELKRRCDRLSSVREERALVREAVRADILALYELLQTAPAERMSMSDVDLSRKAMDTFEKERTRLIKLKTVKMGDLIEAATVELRGLYAELGLGEGRIPELKDKVEPNERVLNALQEETKIMRSVIESCRSITQLIPKRQKLRALHEEVKQRQQDPTRLLNKQGGRKLLEEQKMEHMVKHELPPLERTICSLISEWEKQHGRDFLYNGERYAAVIQRDQQEDLRSAEERKARIAERKMRDLDSSSVFEKSVIASSSSSKTAAPSAVPATARPAVKTQARTAPPPRDVQSAKAVSRTAARTESAPAQAPVVAVTPSNVAARPANPVSVNRARPAAPAPETTPVARSATGKYSKVRSKIDTGLNLKPVTNTIKL